MPNVRSSKQHIYNPSSGEGAYIFDALHVVQDTIYSFYGGGTTNFISSVPVSAAGTSVLVQLLLPQTCVIVKVSWAAAAVASVSTSDNQINFQVGPPASNVAGAYGAGFAGTTGGAAIGAAQKTTTAGLFLFAKSQNVYTVNAGTTLPIAVSAVPDVPEAFYAAGSTILAQIYTGTSGGVTFPLSVSLLCATYDAKPTVSTANPSTDF